MKKRSFGHLGIAVVFAAAVSLASAIPAFATTCSYDPTTGDPGLGDSCVTKCEDTTTAWGTPSGGTDCSSGSVCCHYITKSLTTPSPSPSAPTGPDCETLRASCTSGSKSNYAQYDATACAPPDTAVATSKCTTGGASHDFVCCQIPVKTAACTDTCVTPDRCVSDATQTAEDKTPLDCPVGETCCALTPITPASTDAAKAAAAGATVAAPSVPTEAPLKTANPFGYVPPLGNLTVNQIVGRIVQAVLPLIGALFLFMFLYGGFLWMTAGGEEKRVTQARQTLAQAAIGMVIVIGAYVIVYNILNLLGGTLTG